MPLNWIFDNVPYGVSPTSLVVAIATLVVAVAYYSLKNSGLPPGPTGVPLLGYWPFIRPKEGHLQFDGLKKKYGDVFSFTCTGKLYIHLGTVKAVREAHIGKSDCFGKRNEGFSIMTELFGGGVVLQNSEEWKTNRKFFTAAMKERGLASIQESLSGSLYDSINSIVDELRKKGADEPVDIVELLSGECNVTLRRTLFGDSGVVSDQVVKEINEYFAVVMACMTAANFLPYGNFAKYIILPFTPGYRESKASLVKAKKKLFEIIDEHKATYDEENIRDIIDEFIKERNLRRNKGDPTAKYFTDSGLVGTLLQLVGDGSLSVALFITLMVKAVIDHPEEQEKIYRELVEVVGVDRQPTIEDKSRLTYTNAFIQEVLRMSADFFPFFPSLECTKETTLRGYRIPKGAVTVMNFYSAHNDPETYEHPEKFDPSRFISQEGKQRPDLPITFGVGKRACIGEGFTMMQVLLFVTTIIKNFRLSIPEGMKITNADLMMTGKLKILVQPRSHD